MPTTRRTRRRGRVGRRKGYGQSGEGFKDVLGKINNFLKKSKIVSTAAKALGNAGVPYAGKIGTHAESLGYGRIRRRRRIRA